jgi:uroporphyrinogen decarboxylase
MKMTPRERVLTTSRRQVPDRVPKWIDYESFAPGLMQTFREKTGASLPEEFFEYEVRQIRFKPPAPRPELKPYIPAELPQGAEIDWDWGNIWVRGEHRNVIATAHYALGDAQTVGDIEAYPMPDFLAKYRWEHVRDAVDALHRRELAAMGAMSMTLFEVAWGVRGFENFLMDMLDGKEMSRVLLDRITEVRCQMARIFAQAGVDVLRLGDDVGTERGMMIGKATWAEWLKPRLARVIRAAREVRPDILVFYHSDGDCREVIPGLIEIGVDILNPIQPECMDPAETKRLYGDRLAFWGTIGTQTTMPFGTPDDVRREVVARIETVGRGGGLLLGPSHLLQDEVPWDNVLAFFEAVDKYGVYG